MVSNGLLVLSNGMFFRGRIQGPFRPKVVDGYSIPDDRLPGNLTDPSYCGQIVTMTAPISEIMEPIPMIWNLPPSMLLLWL